MQNSDTVTRAEQHPGRGKVGGPTTQGPKGPGQQLLESREKAMRISHLAGTMTFGRGTWATCDNPTGRNRERDLSLSLLLPTDLLHRPSELRDQTLMHQPYRAQSRWRRETDDLEGLTAHN